MHGLLLLFVLGCIEPPQNPLAIDNDGDGYTEFDGDCDDSDPSLLLQANDQDCDGVLTEEDCDDGNANNTSLRTSDEDGDGVNCEDDCDDGDPTTINDMDCDGVITEDDCDDTNPNAADTSNDQDCDGVPTEEDCDDGNAALATDADGDGVCDGICSGDFTITDSSDVVNISHCVEITGYLEISATSLTNVDDLSNLTNIGKYLTISDGPLFREKISAEERAMLDKIFDTI